MSILASVSYLNDVNSNIFLIATFKFNIDLPSVGPIGQNTKFLELIGYLVGLRSWK